MNDRLHIFFRRLATEIKNHIVNVLSLCKSENHYDCTNCMTAISALYGYRKYQNFFRFNHVLTQDPAHRGKRFPQEMGWIPSVFFAIKFFPTIFCALIKYVMQHFIVAKPRWKAVVIVASDSEHRCFQC